MSKITYETVIVNTVAKVGSSNFLSCNYSQSAKIHVHHGHSLLTLQNTLNNKSNCLIIVGIRNPIDRNLSYLFQTYNEKELFGVETKKIVIKVNFVIYLKLPFLRIYVMRHQK